MEYRVNDNCIGCGMCVSMCPDVFAIDNEYARVIADPKDEETRELARQAAQNCPTEAIEHA